MLGAKVRIIFVIERRNGELFSENEQILDVCYVSFGLVGGLTYITIFKRVKKNPQKDVVMCGLFCNFAR